MITTMALVLLLGGPEPPSVLAEYVDDDRCARCHADISHGFTTLGMGRSFTVPGPDTAIADFSPEGGRFLHTPSGQHYRMWLDDDGRMWMRQYEVAADGREINGIDIEAHFAVGSGNHARTYLHRSPNGELWELPVSWYAEDGWGMSPGFDRAEHDRFGRRVGRECMFCHNAYPDVPQGEDRLGRPEVFPAVLPEGIGCQRCHGPGRRHVDLAYSADATDAQIAGSILNPADLPPAQQDEVCLQCHMQPTSRLASLVRPFDRGDFSYRPGEPLNAYITHVDFDTPESADAEFEVNHHGYQLQHSACWDGPGSMTCLSCHDPHHKPDRATAIERYRAACLSCHTEPECTVEAVTGHALDPAADCTTCHMPKRRPSDAVHTLVTDHRIQRPPTDPTALLAARTEAPPPTAMTPRPLDAGTLDPALVAHLGRVLSGDNSTAMELHGALPDDASTAMRMMTAESLLEGGHRAAAVSLLRELTAESPWLVHGQVNLALVEAQTGSPRQAINRLRRAIEDAPASADAWGNLSALLWASGERDEAIDAGRTAARLQMVNAEHWHRLGTQLASTGDLPAAVDAFQRAESLHPGDATNAYNLGLAQRKSGHHADATRTWAHALGRSPADVRLLKMAAIASGLPAHQVAGPDAAAAALELARRWHAAAPDQADALAVQAALLLSTGSPREASAMLQQAANAKADLAAVRLVQAMLLDEAGRRQDAVTVWTEVTSAINRPDRRTMLRDGLVRLGQSRFAG